MNIKIFNDRVIEIYETSSHTGKRRAKIEKIFFENIKIYYPNFKNQNISELYFWIQNNLTDYPKCLNCGKNVVKFRSVKDGYNSDYCCMKCAINGHNRNEKSRKTCISRYGVEYPNQSKEIRTKTENTCLERYGFTNVCQVKTIKDKMSKTMFARYGDDYSKTRRKYKILILPSGTEIKYQGYEHIAILELLKVYTEEQLKIHLVPKIFYEYEGNNRFHLPDLFIPEINLLIEVKSSYTFNIKKDQNLIKQKAAKEMGFKYEIWVCDKGKVIQKI